MLTGGEAPGNYPMYFNRFRKRAQSVHWWRESCTMGGAGREDKSNMRHVEAKVAVPRSVIQLGRGYH